MRRFRFRLLFIPVALASASAAFAACGRATTGTCEDLNACPQAEAGTSADTSVPPGEDATLDDAQPPPPEPDASASDDASEDTNLPDTNLPDTTYDFPDVFLDVAEPDGCATSAPSADGVFVSPTGVTTAGCGTVASPCKTVQLGIAAAVSGSKSIVYVDQNPAGYIESITLSNGITVQGGWHSADGGTWERTCVGDPTTDTVIQAPPTSNITVSASGVAATLDTLRLSAKSSANPGESLYGVVAINGASVTLSNVVLLMSPGGAGANGGPGSPGSGVTACTTPGNSANGANGTPGSAGSPGSFVDGAYVAGGVGGTGGSAGTGACGGAGTAGWSDTCGGCTGECTGGGGGTGTSGAGDVGSAGNPGKPGSGGAGGGSSVGILLWGGSAAVVGGEVIAAAGGVGGNGGTGGSGSAGAAGGNGTPGDCTGGLCHPEVTKLGTTYVCTPFELHWDGGAGGAAGGKGGTAGTGGGGAGGDSYDYYAGPDASITVQGTNLVTATHAASGGTGGNPGPNGVYGQHN